MHTYIDIKFSLQESEKYKLCLNILCEKYKYMNNKNYLILSLLTEI